MMSSARSILRVSLYWVLQIFIIAFIPGISFAITAEDIAKIEEKAAFAQLRAKRYDAKVNSLDNELQLALDKMEEAREGLKIANEEDPISEYNVKMSEKNLDFATKKVDFFREKLKNAKEKAITAQTEAEETSWLANKLNSKRRHDQAVAKVRKTEQRLKEYKERVKELENEERIGRAEFIAKTKIAGIAEGRWERWRANMSKQLAENKAKSLFEDLGNYREKVIDTTRELEWARTDLKAAETEYARFKEPESEE